MDMSFHLDMITLVVSRIVGIVVLAIAVSVMTLRRSQPETVLFCWSLLAAVATWIALIAAVVTHSIWVTTIYVGCISTHVSLQWAAMAKLSGRKVALPWFVVPPAFAMLSVVILGLDGDAASLLSSNVLSAQLAVASLFIICHGAPLVRARTSILMGMGYAMSFCSAASWQVGAIFWPDLLVDRLAPVPAVTLPFIASYIGTILITLSWIAALKDRAESALAELAFRDELTGLANRRRLRTEGRRLWERSRKQGRALSLLALDVDHFKQVNDRWGHDEGDRVLSTLGQIVADFRPKPEIAARMGGEEFCLIFAGADARLTHTFAERLREEFGERLHLPDGSPVRFSAGVAQSGDADGSIDAVYSRADNALYQAKASGRDCTIISAALEATLAA